MGGVSREEIEAAKQVDILDYLRRHEPENLKPVGMGLYSLRDHDSFMISNGKWCWNSQGFGCKTGTALNYLTRVRGYSFTEAVRTLLEDMPHRVHSVPAFRDFDLCVGLVGTAAVFLMVLYKKKHAKKWRKDVEYGSARWGNKKDIAPYTDPKPENNIILTASESLMLSGRPKHPKHARNKNVLIVGGSGSGKTRFWLKPNLMQMHSSYVVTDPKGLLCRGRLLEIV